MLSQDMINLAITCSGAIIGWFLKTIWEALRDLKGDLRDIENEMHTQYIRRDEVQKNFDEIKSILREIFADLKNKADKQEAVIDFDTLSIVEFGDNEGLQRFLFENSIQHQLFRDSFFDQGLIPPAYPLYDADPNNLDDWLLAHQVEHQFFAAQLGLSNPFNMLDADFGKQDDFYDWIGQHLTAHEQIATALGLN